MPIELIENPDLSLINFFEERIREFNEARWDVKKKFPLAVQVKNENNEIVAGAAAKTFGFWLLIDNLWVQEDLRRKKMGRDILLQLEKAAKSRGCRYSLLETLNFQAQPFYEKFGYATEWIQKDYPTTGCKYFMVKDLQLT